QPRRPLRAMGRAARASMRSARAAAAAASAGATAGTARRLVRALALTAAAFLASAVLLVDRGVADLGSTRRRVAALFGALLDVVSLTLLFARVLRFASSRHALETAHHVPRWWPVE